MATSGTYDFSLNRNEIITEALRELRRVAIGDTPNADLIKEGNIILNVMIKAWRADGISLPLYQEVTVYLEPGKQSYLIGPSGNQATAVPQKTELSVAGVATDLTITVDSDDNIANGDIIGVALDDNTMLWTTVNGVPAANVVTLTAALPSSAAIDNHVYSYTKIAQRPVTVKDARFIINDGEDIPVKVSTREEYFDLPAKTTQGTVNLVYYDPQITNGILYVWQTADSVSDTLQLTVQRQVEDFDNPTDDPDFPQEWLYPLYMGVAKRWMNRFGVDQITRASVTQGADEAYEIVKNFDVEGEFFFVPASADDSY